MFDFKIEVIRASNQVVGCRFLQVVSRARFAGFTGYLGSIKKGSSLVFGFWEKQKVYSVLGFGLEQQEGAAVRSIDKGLYWFLVVFRLAKKKFFFWIWFLCCWIRKKGDRFSFY